MRDAFTGSAQAASGPDVQQMFNDLTNQTDEDDKGEKRADREPEREKERDTKWDGDEDMELFFDGP